MRRLLLCLVTLALLPHASARADVFNLGAGLTNLEMVTVGDAGNAADTASFSQGLGSVGYAYQIGKYEVTAAQYVDFLNFKAKSDPYLLYNSAMSIYCGIQRSGSTGNYIYSVSSDWANRPVTLPTYWNACRFVNWLCNDQGTGDTETGAYTLNGYNGSDGRTIIRNSGAKWYLPNETEWYKAAFYRGGGANSGYWTYPTRSNSVPGRTPGGSNDANYDGLTGIYVDPVYHTTNVGAFRGSFSPYGTYDQGGNAWEMTEKLIIGDVVYRAAHGGSYFTGSNCFQKVKGGQLVYPAQGDAGTGFRVAAAVPEPSSMATLSVAMVGLLMGLKRRRG